MASKIFKDTEPVTLVKASVKSSALRRLPRSFSKSTGIKSVSKNENTSSGINAFVTS